MVPLTRLDDDFWFQLHYNDTSTATVHEKYDVKGKHKSIKTFLKKCDFNVTFCQVVRTLSRGPNMPKRT